MDKLEGARSAKAAADASLKVSNDLVAAVEAKLQQLQDKFMEASSCSHVHRAQTTGRLMRMLFARPRILR